MSNYAFGIVQRLKDCFPEHPGAKSPPSKMLKSGEKYIKVPVNQFPLSHSFLAIVEHHVENVKDMNVTDMPTYFQALRKEMRREFGDESWLHRKVLFMVSCVLVLMDRDAVSLDLSRLAWVNIEQLVEKKPEFTSLPEAELQLLLRFRNGMKVAMQFIPARNHKGLLLEIAARISEGKVYITGAGQTAATTRRVRIYEMERQDIVHSRPSMGGGGDSDDDGNRNESDSLGDSGMPGESSEDPPAPLPLPDSTSFAPAGVFPLSMSMPIMSMPVPMSISMSMPMPVTMPPALPAAVPASPALETPSASAFATVDPTSVAALLSTIGGKRKSEEEAPRAPSQASLASSLSHKSASPDEDIYSQVGDRLRNKTPVHLELCQGILNRHLSPHQLAIMQQIVDSAPNDQQEK